MSSRRWEWGVSACAVRTGQNVVRSTLRAEMKDVKILDVFNSIMDYLRLHNVDVICRAPGTRTHMQVHAGGVDRQSPTPPFKYKLFSFTCWSVNNNISTE